MKYPVTNMRFIHKLAIAGCAYALFASLNAQDGAVGEEVYELSPFSIDDSQNQGYYSSQTFDCLI